MPRITIKDIAKKAGVSVSTVSQVLNDKGRISPETRNRVMDVINRSDFYPSRTGRALVNRKSGNIAVFVSDDHFTILEPFYNHIYFGAEVIAQESDYYLILHILRKKNAGKTPRCLAENSIDGALILGSIDSSIIRMLDERGLPVVFVDYYPQGGNYSAVLIKNNAGAKVAGQHLVDLGYETIGFIGNDFDHPSIRERFQGYREMLKENHIPFDSDFVVTEKSNERNFGYQTGLELAKRKKKPRAFLCANDWTAIGLMKALSENHVSVPEEVAVVGFDDIEASSHVSPSLTTMHVFRKQMGQMAMKRITDLLRGNEVIHSTVYVDTKLVARKSSGSPYQTTDDEFYL